MDIQSDQELLLTLATQHAEGALDHILRKHGPMVLSVCRRVLGDYHEAEDAFQATFIVLVRRHRSLTLNKALGAWLLLMVGATIATLGRRRIASMKLNSITFAAALFAFAFTISEWASNPAIAQTVNPIYAGQLNLTHVVGNNPPGSVPTMGQIAQMALHPNGKNLFVASYELGIVRFDYNFNVVSKTTSLTNATLVWQNPTSDAGIRGSLGLAFHQDSTLGTVLYFSQAVPFVPGFQSSVVAETGRLQTVRRITDSNGDGTWGGVGDINQAILNNIQVNTQHEINNLAIRRNSLFMGIGTQTDPGNNETAYTGTISWIEDLTLLSSDTRTPNIAGFDTPSGNGLGADGYHADDRPFTSTDNSKLRVYATGARNPFGVAVQGANRTGDVWFSMNQQDESSPGGVKPDEFHRTFHQADHGFPKWYQTDGNLRNAHLVGPQPPIATPEQTGVPPVDLQLNPLDDHITNWKADPAALAAGFFHSANNVAPWATLGNHVSANGFDFYYGNHATFYGDAFVARFGPDDIRAIDTTTGEQISLVRGLLNPLSVLRVPGGLLIGDSGAIRFLHFIGDPVPEPAGAEPLLVAAMLCCCFHRGDIRPSISQGFRKTTV